MEVKLENITIFVTNIEIMKIFSFEKKINIRRTSYQLRLKEALNNTDVSFEYLFDCNEKHMY